MDTYLIDQNQSEEIPSMVVMDKYDRDAVKQILADPRAGDKGMLVTNKDGETVYGMRFQSRPIGIRLLLGLASGLVSLFLLWKALNHFNVDYLGLIPFIDAHNEPAFFNALFFCAWLGLFVAASMWIQTPQVRRWSPLLLFWAASWEMMWLPGLVTAGLITERFGWSWWGLISFLWVQPAAASFYIRKVIEKTKQDTWRNP